MRLRRRVKYVGGPKAWNSDGASPVVPNASGSTPVYLVQRMPTLRTAAEIEALRERKMRLAKSCDAAYDNETSRNRMKSPSSKNPATERLGCSRTSTVRACSNSDASRLMRPSQLNRLAQRIRSVLL